jgi:hypothetical protein
MHYSPAGYALFIAKRDKSLLPRRLTPIKRLL